MMKKDIQILDTPTFSAATALGFASSTNIVFTWSNTEHFGYLLSDLQELHRMVK